MTSMNYNEFVFKKRICVSSPAALKSSRYGLFQDDFQSRGHVFSTCCFTNFVFLVAQKENLWWRPRALGCLAHLAQGSHDCHELSVADPDLAGQRSGGDTATAAWRRLSDGTSKLIN